MKVRRIIILAMAAAIMSPFISADTHAAASASYADVAAAVTASANGDTVTIPAGAATWASTLTYSKAITLQGNGIGSTIITHAVTAIQVTGTEGAQWIIKGIEFTSDDAESIYSIGNCHNFRITACEFNNTGTVQGQELVWIGSNSDSDQQYGVIDNCTFDNGRILVMAGQGDRSWKEPSALGGAEAVYVEDCTFTETNGLTNSAIDSSQGGRYVFRHNTVSDIYLLAHSLQNGNSSWFARGTKKWEIYENTIGTSYVGYPHSIAITVLAGTGVIFNNTVTSGGAADPWNVVVRLNNVRSYEAGSGNLGMADGGNILDGNTAYDATATGAHNGLDNAATLSCSSKTWTPDAYIGMYVYNLTDGSKGAITDNDGATVTATLAGGTDNNWDIGDTFKITNGYPALDQIGRGIDASLTPQLTPAYDSSYQPQTSEPCYFWGNTREGSNDPVEVYSGATKHIVSNRDYYDYTVSFDGTSGVGRGTLAARPATCTTGVGYWATDTEILYVATAANVWETYYKPYTYPHPLRAEGTPPDVLTVTSPNGGESWAGLSVHNITWTNTGSTVYANVKIQYSTDSGATWTEIVASTPNTGTYSWTVPNTASATCLIKVSVVV